VASLVHVGVHAAALDHEAGDHAVEDRAVEVAVLGVLEEIRGADRRPVGVELHDEIAERGFELDHGWTRCGCGKEGRILP